MDLPLPVGAWRSAEGLGPITKTLWQEVDRSRHHGDVAPNTMDNGMAIVLLPTRELAAQVAGVASVLAPPGMVRLVPMPMDLMTCWQEEVHQGKDAGYRPRILVGSARAISASLFGNKKLPAMPTAKPQA